MKNSNNISPIPSPRRRALRVAAIACAVFVLAAFGAILFFSLPPGERIIKNALEGQLSTALGQPVRLAQFETNLFTRVRVSGVELLDRRDSARILAINDILLNYSLIPIMRGELHLISLHIDSVQAAVLRDTAGKSGLMILDQARVFDEGPTDTTPSFFRVRIDTMHLSSLSALYADEAHRFVAEVRELSFRLVRDASNSYSFTAGNRSGTVRYGKEDTAAVVLAVSGNANPRHLRFDEVMGEFAGMTLSGSALIPEEESEELRASLSLTGNPNRLLNTLGITDITTDSELSLRCTMTGTRENPVASLLAQVSRVGVRGMRLERARLAVQATRNEILIDTLVVSGYGGSVQAHGRYLPADTAIRNGTVNFHNIDLSALVRDFTGALPTTGGSLSGRVRVEGRGSHPKGWNVEAHATISSVTFRGEDLQSATMRGQMREGLFHAVLEQENNTLSIHGGVINNILRGQLKVEIPHVATFAQLAGFDGARGDFHASGAFSFADGKSDIRVRANGKGLAFRNVPLDTIHAEVHYERNEVRIPSLEFVGTLHPIPNEAPPFDLKGLVGNISYAGHLSGTLTNLTGTISATATELEYGGRKLDSAGILCLLDGSRVELAHGRFVSDSLELFLGGWFDTRTADGELTMQATKPCSVNERSDAGSIHTRIRTGGNSFELSGSGRDIDLSAFAPLVSDTLAIGGKVDCDFSFSGPFHNPQILFTTRVSHPYFETLRIDSIGATLSLSNHLIALERFSMHQNDHRATAKGTLRLLQDSLGTYRVTPASTIGGMLSVERFNLQTFEPLMPAGGVLTGYTMLDIECSGTVAKPGITGVVLLDSLSISASPDVEPLRLSMKAVLSDTVVSIEYANGMALGQPFVISGFVTRQGLEYLRTDVAMDFSESGKFVGRGIIGRENIDYAAEINRLDLALFRPFVPRIKDFAGVLDSRITLSGNTMMPHMEGFLSARNVALKPEGLEQGISNGVLKVGFAGNTVVIDSLFARVGEGAVLVTGGFAVAQESVRDVRLAAQAGGIRLSTTEFSITVDTASLQYAPRNEYYLFTGDIKFGESRLTKNIEPDAILPWARSVERPETELPVLLQQTRMDIRVRESENLWVDNNLARMRMHAALSITGNPARPNLSGRLMITNGYLLYLDRKFDIKEGDFLFSNPNRLNPDIRLKAEAQVTTYQGISPQTYTVQFSAEGPMEQLAVNLTSDPPLDKPDIVALLTVGATRSQLTAGNGSPRNVLIDRVQMIASGRISNMLTQRAGTLLGLDEMSVQGNLFSFNGDAGPKLVLGKQLGDRARITYSMNVGRSNEQSVRVDYQLTNRFSLLGETTQAGRSSLSLKYGLLFK